MEQTPNGIKYEWWLSGPDGAHYELHPIRNLNTRQQVETAKQFLRNNFDVVSIKTIWRSDETVEMVSSQISS